jgi:hypothetical protein
MAKLKKVKMKAAKGKATKKAAPANPATNQGAPQANENSTAMLAR